ncbi:MAG: alpha/beta hydrolase [Methanomicrobiaceae archaeon]|nr:alpha/beta hydrolase [Methanomicrobiaceae archaeon]
MQTEKSPVVLVHGWKSNPKVWEKLIFELESEGIKFWNFSHSEMKDSAPNQISEKLRQYIFKMKTENGYSGNIDIICHSMGTCIVRYMLEVLDGKSKEVKVRQIIALGPPNKGSSMAELFNDPTHGSEIITRLSGLFVPKTYDPKKDKIVQEIRPGSKTVDEIHNAGIREDILYRLILAVNKTKSSNFFPCFNGKTWELQEDKTWVQSFEGDGVIPYSESYLKGAGYDVFPVNCKHFEENSNEYCHILLPQNSEIIKRIIQYLKYPDTQPESYFF